MLLGAKQVGVIVFTHLATGRRYIGRSSDLRSYLNQIKKFLRDGRLENKTFQEAYDQDSRITHEVIPIEYDGSAKTKRDAIEESIELQHKLLLEGWEKGDLFNKFLGKQTPIGIKTRLEVMIPDNPIEVCAKTLSSLNFRTSSDSRHSVAVFELTYRSSTLTSKCYGGSVSLMRSERIPTSLKGIYILLDEGSGSFYIGSSMQLHIRLSAHRGDLSKGIHRNRNLQILYDRGAKNLVALFVSFPEGLTEQTLRDLEQELLDTYSDNPNLLNSSKNVEKFGLGLKHPPRDEATRRMMSEVRRKKIQFKGCLYPSASAAAQATGISISAISSWARSTEEKHRDCFYV